jgi:hypothetical protein
MLSFTVLALFGACASYTAASDPGGSSGMPSSSSSGSTSSSTSGGTDEASVGDATVKPDAKVSDAVSDTPIFPVDTSAPPACDLSKDFEEPTPITEVNTELIEERG